MAEVKFSELAAITTLSDNDILPIVDISELAVNASKKVTVQQMRANLAASGANTDITSLSPSGTLGITPAAGSNLNINLATTGDLAVNTNQLYVDTSAGNVGIGTSAPGEKLRITNGNILLSNNYFLKGQNASALTKSVIGINGNNVIIVGADGQSVGVGVLTNALSALDVSGNIAAGAYAGINTAPANGMIISGNVGIGTPTPGNILTLPAGSATDPIADAWTVHCLGAYKEAETAMDDVAIKNEALEKVKCCKVSRFTKRAIVDRSNTEMYLKNNFKNEMREEVRKNLVDTGEETEAQNEDRINEILNNLWEAKPEKDAIVDAKVLEEEGIKKLLPKFQKINYGVIAEDAPTEAQVYDAQGRLQGVDPYALIGIMWAAMQAQEQRIISLEAK